MKHPAHTALAITLACLCLAACGTRGVRDQAPFIQVTSWRIQGQELYADLRIRNVNDEPLPIERVEFTVRADDLPLAAYEGTHLTEVSANGTASLSLAMQAEAAGARLLGELDSGQRASLPYRLEGRIHTAGGINYPIDRNGHIYTMPGRPGQYR